MIKTRGLKTGEINGVSSAVRALQACWMPQPCQGRYSPARDVTAVLGMLQPCQVCYSHVRDATALPGTLQPCQGRYSPARGATALPGTPGEVSGPFPQPRLQGSRGAATARDPKTRDPRAMASEAHLKPATPEPWLLKPT